MNGFVKPRLTQFAREACASYKQWLDQRKPTFSSYQNNGDVKEKPRRRLNQVANPDLGTWVQIQNTALGKQV